MSTQREREKESKSNKQKCQESSGLQEEWSEGRETVKKWEQKNGGGGDRRKGRQAEGGLR